MKLTKIVWRPTRKTFRLPLFMFVIVGLLGSAATAPATDYIWTNTAASGLYTNTAIVWDQGAVPTATDTVIFTNAAAYRVFFSNSAPLDVSNVYFTNTAATSMSVTQAIGTGQSWTVNDLYFVGAAFTAGQSNRSVISAGTLAVTNSGGTGQILVGNGSGGAGVLILNGGTVWADHLFITNNTSTTLNSILSLASGTLNTLSGSRLVLTNNQTFSVGGTWNVLGGTTVVSSPLGTGTVTMGVNSKLVISGANTTFTNAVVQATGQYFLVNGINAQLVISNGAQMVFTGPAPSDARVNQNGYNLTVSGLNSRLVGTNFSGWRLGEATDGAFVVSNNAHALLGNLYIGYNLGKQNNLTVTDGGVLTNTGSLYVGYGGFQTGGVNSVTIKAGGKVITAGNAAVGWTAAASLVGSTNNTALVTGIGSLWQISGNLGVGDVADGSLARKYLIANNNSLTITDGAIVTASNAVISAGMLASNSFNVGNQITVSGGSLFVTNATAAGGSLVVGRTTGQGTFTLNSGTVRVDKLIVTNNIYNNPAGGSVFNTNVFNFNGGTLITKSTAVTNDQEFLVGNGTSTAAFELLGGTHAFANGLVVTNYAHLSGNGSVVSPIKNLNYLLATNGTLTLTDIISGTGSNLVSSSATLVLSGANTYSGGTVVRGGTLKVNNTLGSGTGSGAVTIQSAGTLSGVGIITGSVTVQSGGTLSPGNSVGTNTVGSLTLNAGSNLRWEFNPTANDLTVVSNPGGLTVNGGKFYLYNESGGTDFNTPGLYRLIQYSGSLGGSGSGALTWNNNSSGLTNLFGANTIAGANYVTLRIGGGFGRAYDGQGTGLVDPGDANWTNPLNWGSDTAPQALDRLSFATSPYGRLTTTNNFAAGTQFSGFVFSNNAPAFILAGNRVNLEGDIVNNGTILQTLNLDLWLDTIDASFNTAAGDILMNGLITNTVAGLGLSKTGAKTLYLSGTQTYSGPTTVNQGTLVVNGALAGSGAVFVQSGASLAGTGTVAGATTVASGGIINPGAPTPQTLTFATSLTLSNNFVYNWDLGLTSTDLVVATTLNFAGSSWTLRLDTPDGFVPTQTNDVFVLMQWSTGVNTDALTNSVTIIGNGRWSGGVDNAQVYIEGNQLLLSGVKTIPEPTVVFMWLAGAVTLWAARRRKA